MLRYDIFYVLNLNKIICFIKNLLSQFVYIVICYIDIY